MAFGCSGDEQKPSKQNRALATDHPEEIGISLDKEEVYECGAIVLTLFAYPDRRDDKHRASLHASLCARAIWTLHLQDPQSVARISIAPQYLRDSKIVDRDCNLAMKRLKHRIIAGRMAAALFMRAIHGTESVLPDGVKSLSLNELSKMVQRDAGYSDASSVETLIWRPSLPVIHIAAAVCFFVQKLARDGFQVDFDDYLLRRPLIEAIVRQSVIFEALIRESAWMPIDPNVLIKLHVV